MTHHDQWTEAERLAALAEGWALEQCEAGMVLCLAQPSQPQPCNWASPEQALAHVHERARLGSRLHLQALVCLDRADTLRGEYGRRLCGASAAVVAWRGVASGEMAAGVRDVIADLLHYADFCGQDPERELLAASEAYEAERAERSGLTQGGYAALRRNAITHERVDAFLRTCLAPDLLSRPEIVVERDGEDFRWRDRRESAGSRSAPYPSYRSAVAAVLAQYRVDRAACTQAGESHELVAAFLRGELSVFVPENGN